MLISVADTSALNCTRAMCVTGAMMTDSLCLRKLADIVIASELSRKGSLSHCDDGVPSLYPNRPKQPRASSDTADCGAAPPDLLFSSEML